MQTKPPYASVPASASLRWSVTLQAMAGAASLLALLGIAAAMAMYAIGIVGPALWSERPLWAGFRLALGIPAIAAAAIILRWLWSPTPPPRGIPIGPLEAPDFFHLLERFSSRFGVERKLKVRVTGEMNASIANHPRGFTLQIGLPLLLSVTPKQCTAILAHEFGHLCLQRVGPGAWTSHLRAWWHRVLSDIDTDHSVLGRVVSVALRRADRRYLADSLRLSHEDEFEADAWAAQTIGAEPLAGALFSIAAKERFLVDDFWQKVHAQADYDQQPTILPFQQMASALKAGYDPTEAAAVFDSEALDHDEEITTHPSISARCAKLAVDPRRQRKDAAMAAEIYLQGVLPRLALELDLAWWAENGSEWRARHREVQRARRRIALLESSAQKISIEERLELAALVESYCVERDPLALYLVALAAGSPCAQALLGAGRLMLERQDSQGTQYLLQAMAEDSEVGLAAAAYLLGFAQRQGVDWLEQRAVQRAGQLLDLASAVREEGERDPLGESWEPHGLDPMTLRKLAKTLATQRQIRRCYLVRRVSAAVPLWIAYVLVARTDSADVALATQLREMAEAILPEERPVRVLLVGRDSEWETRAAAIDKAQLRILRRRIRGQTRS